MYQGWGHQNYFQSLKNCIECSDGKITPVWIPLDVAEPSALNLPMVGPNALAMMSRRARRRVLEVHRETPLDALYFWTYEFAIGGESMMRRIPTVLGLDATVSNQRELKAGFPKINPVRKIIHPVRNYLLRQAVKKAARVVATSRWAALSLSQDDGIPENLVDVIPFGVDLQSWSSASSRQQSYGPCRLLFVGAEVRRKGLDLLIKACEDLPIGIWHLDIVSGDPEAQQLCIRGSCSPCIFISRVRRNPGAVQRCRHIRSSDTVGLLALGSH